MATIVTKAEGHLMRIDALEAAVAQGDAKEIASQVGQDFLAPTGVLAVNHPVFLPDVGGGRRAAGRPFLKPHTAGRGRGPRGPGRGPGRPGFSGRATGCDRQRVPRADQQVDMGMIAKSSSPGMEDGQATQTSAHVARVGGELL